MRGRPAGQNARPALSQALEQRILAVPLKDWAWMIGLAFWRAAIAGRLGLGVDEAHYVLYGLRLDLSYFDHPPLVGWIHALAQALFGISELSARLPAIACGLASSIMSYRLALRITGRPLAARAAALALNASFLAAALWLMFLPDTILAPLALWLVEIGARLVERGRRRDWIELGICLGLCGLTKYTAIFFVGSLLGLVASERAWRRLRPGRALAAAAIAAALVAPVFIWNQAHNWISFKYQSGHVLGGSFKLAPFGLFIGGQFAGYSPFLIVAAAIGWWRSFYLWRRAPSPTRPADERPSHGRRDQAVAALPAGGALRLRCALWLALPTLAFFAYASLHDEVLPHWTLVPWAILLPLGLALLLFIKKDRAAWASIGLTGAIALFLMAELLGQFLPFPDWQSPYADLTGWRDVRREVATLAEARPSAFSIAVPNWTLGSRANYYLSDLAPVFVLDDRFDQFDLWEGGPPQTPDLLLVSWRGFDIGEAQKARCQSFEPISRRTFLSHGHAVNQVSLAWCRGYRSP